MISTFCTERHPSTKVNPLFKLLPAYIHTYSRFHANVSAELTVRLTGYRTVDPSKLEFPVMQPSVHHLLGTYTCTVPQVGHRRWEKIKADTVIL